MNKREWWGFGCLAIGLVNGFVGTDILVVNMWLMLAAYLLAGDES